MSATDSVQKRSITKKRVLFLLSIRMSEKTLKFDKKVTKLTKKNSINLRNKLT